MGRFSVRDRSAHAQGAGHIAGFATSIAGATTAHAVNARVSCLAGGIIDANCARCRAGDALVERHVAVISLFNAVGVVGAARAALIGSPAIAGVAATRGYHGRVAGRSATAAHHRVSLEGVGKRWIRPVNDEVAAGSAALIGRRSECISRTLVVYPVADLRHIARQGRAATGVELLKRSVEGAAGWLANAYGAGHLWASAVVGGSGNAVASDVAGVTDGAVESVAAIHAIERKRVKDTTRYGAAGVCRAEFRVVATTVDGNWVASAAAACLVGTGNSVVASDSVLRSAIVEATGCAVCTTGAR